LLIACQLNGCSNVFRPTLTEPASDPVEEWAERMANAADSVSYAYDNAGRLNRPTVIKDNGSANLASYAYDDLSRRTTVTRGNGTTTSYVYDGQGRMNTVAHNLAGSTHDQVFGYSHNQANEITIRSWSNELYQWPVAGNVVSTAVTLSYDAEGRLRGSASAGVATDLLKGPGTTIGAFCDSAACLLLFK
jgi:YD repeat-containing protein